MKWTAHSNFWKWRKLPQPIAEYKFHPDRKWRFDFAWIEKKIALEVEGGIWQRKYGAGGHNRGSGMIRDMEKYNSATKLGWQIYRFSSDQMDQQKTHDFLFEVLRQKAREGP